MHLCCEMVGLATAGYEQPFSSKQSTMLSCEQRLFLARWRDDRLGCREPQKLPEALPELLVAGKCQIIRPWIGESMKGARGSQIGVFHG
jgi:hypothetical protein